MLLYASAEWPILNGVESIPRLQRAWSFPIEELTEIETAVQNHSVFTDRYVRFLGQKREMYFTMFNFSDLNVGRAGSGRDCVA